MTAARATSSAGGSYRAAMISKVKIAQKQLGIDDAAYRAMLARLTGQTSAATCNEAQLAKVLDEFKAKGWKPQAAAAKPGRKPADHPSARKARALWISLHHLGEVRDPAETALEAFAKRQLKVEALQWADQGLTYKLIEALKAMAVRAGWVQDDDVSILKANLIKAQWLRLQGLGLPGEPRGVYSLAAWANDRNITEGKRDVASWSDAELDAGAARLGQAIRQAQAYQARRVAADAKAP